MVRPDAIGRGMGEPQGSHSGLTEIEIRRHENVLRQLRHQRLLLLRSEEVVDVFKTTQERVVARRRRRRDADGASLAANSGDPVGSPVSWHGSARSGRARSDEVWQGRSGQVKPGRARQDMEVRSSIRRWAAFRGALWVRLGAARRDVA